MLGGPPLYEDKHGKPMMRAAARAFRDHRGRPGALAGLLGAGAGGRAPHAGVSRGAHSGVPGVDPHVLGLDRERGVIGGRRFGGDKKTRFSAGFRGSGERGIRTPGRLPYDGFRDRYLKPLRHLSNGRKRIANRRAFAKTRPALYWPHAHHPLPASPCLGQRLSGRFRGGLGPSKPFRFPGNGPTRCRWRRCPTGPFWWPSTPAWWTGWCPTFELQAARGVGRPGRQRQSRADRAGG